MTPFAFLTQKGLFTKILTLFELSKGVTYRVLVFGEIREVDAD